MLTKKEIENRIEDIKSLFRDHASGEIKLSPWEPDELSCELDDLETMLTNHEYKED